MGSQAYGIAKAEGSDRDEKGVCLEPIWAAMPLNGEFEQYEYRTAAERTGIKDARSEAGDLDLTIYSLRKFLRLATYGNPNVVELLFVRRPDCRLIVNEIGEQLQLLAPFIVSRQAGRRYLGYMEAQRQRLLGERGQMKVKRTELIEEHGYDTKYASHLIRLGFQGVELQETGTLQMPCPDEVRSTLRDIRAGLESLNTVLNLAGNLETKLKDLIKDGPLQDQPNYELVEEWMQDTYLTHWREVL